MRVRVKGVALIGPGLPSWEAARPILAGKQPWEDAPIQVAVPTALAPRERRRASPVVRLALNAASAACADAGLAPEVPACVFASAIGDGTVSHAILSALAGPDRLISPTHFHNSVHNATAGYWSQAVGSHAASTSLAAGDSSFGVGLLKALLTATVEKHPVLLVVSDYPFPQPLHAHRPIAAPLAVALVLMPDEHGNGPVLTFDGPTGDAVTPVRCAALRPLWEGCPPGRGLPVLEGLLTPARVVLSGGGEWRFAVTVSP